MVSLGSVLSPFLFSLAFSVIWSYFPSPPFPSQFPLVTRISAIWIIAYADDLAVICASSVYLTRCLNTLSKALKVFWLKINQVKTEVVTFAVGRPNPRRPPLPVRLGSVVLPRANFFKYLGVTISSNGSLILASTSGLNEGHGCRSRGGVPVQKTRDT